LKTGIVYLIGAGPGDPGLITVRGLDCLRRADVVVYDYLANPALLAEAPAAEHIYVGKTAGCHHRPQAEINALLAELAAAGKVVARLKGGDPYLFGRGGEEALHLRQQGLAFEVVPGVTAAFAAAAYAGIPLTHRDFTTSLGLITGHEDPAKKFSSLDWEKLATGVGTLVFYMGMANLELIARELVAHGRSPQTPVAVVRWATTPRQQTLTGTLADIAQKVRDLGFKPPAIIIVGAVVSLRESLRWFDNRPLFGKRVLVTRSADQAGRFAALLAEAGAEALPCPVLEVLPAADSAPFDAALANLARTDLLILTSANAVEQLFSRLQTHGRDLRALAGVEIVVVGPKTGEALAAHGLRPDLVPADYRAEGVLELLRQRGVAGKRILYPRAELARDLLITELTALGAAVEAPIAYRSRPPQEGAEQLRATLAAGVDAVTFTSSSTVDNLLEMAGPAAAELLAAATIVSIGPLTTATARRHGLTVHVEAASSTLDGMVAAMVDYFSQDQPS